MARTTRIGRLLLRSVGMHVQRSVRTLKEPAEAVFGYSIAE